ncbi:MAG: ADP-glyceromanno-heptose 6-epimerase [Halobacteriovorax sp.]|nr:ADP-glyceromanno-heptose 6-epimerase [Halobacteriovorax sp.]|tara:strand:+ start:42791 stop:43759 length:969 start_codon:yes stop_codon:yes gene_type:complete
MILVTGAAGFIGSVLVKELNESGREDLILVDRLGNDEKWKNLRGKSFIEYIHADELFTGAWDEVLEGISTIYHLGACSSTTERNVDFLMENNVNYSKNLFDLAIERDIPIMYASSAATYGGIEKGFDDDHQKIKELRPLNAYGYSKQLFDEWVLKLEKRPSLWFGIKFFNVFGPNEYHKEEMRSLVHKAYGQIKSNGQVKLFKSHRTDFENGKQLRDFIYVKDCVRAMLAMMEKGSGSGIYNLGTGNANSFDDLVDYTFKAMKETTKIVYIDMPDSIKHQYQYFTEANMQKLNQLLPDFKFTPLEESIKDYVGHLSSDDPHY